MQEKARSSSMLNSLFTCQQSSAKNAFTFSCDCWQVNDEFSLELLRAFSSINNGKGLPKEDDVKAFLERQLVFLIFALVTAEKNTLVA
jgi:hypothetical protein